MTYRVKTTIDIADDLFVRAQTHAKATGQPMRALVEEGLRRVLEGRPEAPYALDDLSVGEAGADNPLESMSWQDLRDAIYGGR